MKNDKTMWAFLLQLGNNIWAKPGDITPYQLEDEESYHDYVYSDRETWRKVTEYLPKCGFNTVVIDIGEALKLDSHPELAVPGSWEKAEFKEELNRLRSLGLTPIPKYNFSTSHNAWMQEYGDMVGTELYKQVCDDIVKEVIEIFDKPEFFHLGLNDENPDYQKYFPVKIVRSWGEKMEDAVRLFNVCLERGVRPWIWADVGTVNEFGGPERFCKYIPKEVLVSNRTKKLVIRMDGSPDAPQTKQYRELADWGYEQVATCYRWEWFLNEKMTMRYCQDYVKKDSVIGYMTAPWLPVRPEYYEGILYVADTFRYARQTIFPEGNADE